MDDDVAAMVDATVHVRTLSSAASSPGMSPLSATSKGARNKRNAQAALRPSLRKVGRRDWKASVKVPR
jgi:hypothetical protein